LIGDSKLDSEQQERSVEGLGMKQGFDIQRTFFGSLIHTIVVERGLWEDEIGCKKIASHHIQ
jgi:hypothetical protein